MVDLFIYVLEADCGEITGIIDPGIVLTPSSAGYSPGVLTAPFYKEPAEGEIRKGFCIEQQPVI